LCWISQPGRNAARLAASKIGSQGHVFEIDLSKPMLDVARAKPRAGPRREDRISAIAGGALRVRFRHGSFSRSTASLFGKNCIP